MTETPRGWIRTTLGELGRYLNGRGFKKSEWAKTGRPIIRIQNLTGSGSSFNYFAGKAEERHVVRRGDLLVSWAATLGVYEWDGPEAVLNQHIFKVESFIDRRFHKYLIERTLSQLLAQAHGTGMVHITRKPFDRTPVLLPPQAEQRRIVEAIEEQLSRADAGIESLRLAKRRLERHRVSILIAAVEGRLVRAEDDAKWPLVAIEDVCEVVSGQTPKGLTDVPGGRIPYFKVGDMNVGDGRRMTVARTHLDEAAVDRNGLRLHAAGTTVFPKRGGAIATNKKRMLVQPSAFDLNTMGVVPGPTVDGNFLWLWFQTVDLSSLSDGSNVPQINHGDIRPLRLALPPLYEQRRIGREVDRQLSVLEATWRTVENGLARAETLRQVILREAFSGRLTAQDPTDEPASTLLDRIREPR